MRCTLALSFSLLACAPASGPPRAPDPEVDPVARTASSAATAEALVPCDLNEPRHCEERCAQGDQQVCADLGVLFVDDGLGTPADRQKAERLFRTACDAGVMAACSNLGTFIRRKGDAADDAEAERLYRKACAANVFEACTDLATMLLAGANRADAVELLRRACDAKGGRACFQLGLLMRGGQGVARDDASAASLFERACATGRGDACQELGLMLADRQPPDHVAASQLFQRGCEMGDAQACISLGGMALLGTSPITQNARLAHELFARGCAYGAASGCFNVGLMYQKTLAQPSPGDSATRRFKQACDMGHAGGCQQPP